MIKKITYFSCLISLITIFILMVILNFTYSEFNSNNVKSNISLLSSDNLSGRLPGSAENSLAKDIIVNNFKQSNLKPFYSGYTQEFETTCPTPTKTKPYFKVSSNGKVEQELVYGIDFKEDMINFRNNTVNFDSSDTLQEYPSHLIVSTGSEKILFYIPEKNNFDFRSSFFSDYPIDMAIMINKNVKKIIVDEFKNKKEFSIHLPFKNEKKVISNVIGLIEGSDDSNPPLILTAHFDHLGRDGAGNIYSGALDNASGTAFIMELQRSLSTFGKPNRDIIFIALNAEEFGLLGSKYFVESNYFNIKGAEVINFDMVGVSDFPVTLMQGTKFKNTNSNLLKSFKNLFKDKDIKYNVAYQDSSDHASFNNFGLDSLTISHSDMSKIHTPNDTAEFIDVESISDIHSVVFKLIQESSYSKLTLALYNKNTLIILSILLLISISFPIVLNKKYNKKKIN